MTWDYTIQHESFPIDCQKKAFLDEYPWAIAERDSVLTGGTVGMTLFEVGDDAQLCNLGGRPGRINNWQGWIYAKTTTHKDFVRRKGYNEESGFWEVYNDFNGFEEFPMWDWETLNECVFGSQWEHEGNAVKKAHDWLATNDYYTGSHWTGNYTKGDVVRVLVDEVLQYFACIADVKGNGANPSPQDDQWESGVPNTVWHWVRDSEPIGGFRRCPRGKTPIRPDWKSTNDYAVNIPYDHVRVAIPETEPVEYSYYRCILPIVGDPNNDAPGDDPTHWEEIPPPCPWDGWPCHWDAEAEEWVIVWQEGEETYYAWKEYDNAGYSYGLALPGDIRGPWMFFDLQVFFNELVWTKHLHVGGTRVAGAATGEDQWDEWEYYHWTEEEGWPTVQFLGFTYQLWEDLEDVGEDPWPAPPLDWDHWNTHPELYSKVLCLGDEETTYPEAKTSLQENWPTNEEDEVYGGDAAGNVMYTYRKWGVILYTCSCSTTHQRMWVRNTPTAIWDGVNKEVDYYGMPTVPGGDPEDFDDFGDLQGLPPDLENIGSILWLCNTEERVADSGTEWISEVTIGHFDEGTPPFDGDWPDDPPPGQQGVTTLRGWGNGSYWIIVRWDVEGGIKKCT